MSREKIVWLKLLFKHVKNGMVCLIKKDNNITSITTIVF